MMVAYFDCNATTPVEPEVADVVRHYLCEEYGNASSISHSYGLAALSAVQRARCQVADVVDCSANDVLFTSGATESNNLAILGMAAYAMERRRKHIITTTIEHKAVLEPVKRLLAQGFVRQPEVAASMPATYWTQCGPIRYSCLSCTRIMKPA